ncbi:Hypothetical predicted protein [Cloeon dipterum]|uniref:Uncharacterized protein n=1 Tax=Cloeon dipterum TaxID=197152 RepID=A0A8S1DQ69_9INSE|nr:Hypothetical predicted protein [Cloeon dipterum]
MIDSTVRPVCIGRQLPKRIFRFRGRFFGRTVYAEPKMDLFPIKLSLKPRLVDPLWFSVDKPCDEEAEIFAMEQELSATLESIANKDSDAPVFGKSNSEMEEIEEDEEEEEEEDNDSDSRGEDEEEEDLDLDHDHMDLTYEHADSPEET